MEEPTGTPRDRYGIAQLPISFREAEPKEFCETCGHSAQLHRIQPQWSCRFCKDCTEFTNDALRQYIAEKQSSKIHGRTIPLSTRKAVLERDGMVCHYCRHKLHTRLKGPHKLHFDHLTPFSRGGTHDLLNIVACCLDCNLSKHDMDESEFMWWRENYRLGCQRKLPTFPAEDE